MSEWAGPIAEVSLERGEISAIGMKISPYKQSQKGWHSCRNESSKMPLEAILRTYRQINVKKQQNCPGKRDEILSYKLKRSLSSLSSCLAEAGQPGFHVNIPKILNLTTPKNILFIYI
jgi:hypothetical protein